MRLKPCPPTPNCVCSNPGTDEKHAVAPLRYPGTLDSAKLRLKAVLPELGNIRWVKEEADYWHLECRTKLLRFVDDLQLAFEPAGEIQVRSSSRLGKYDFGANRKRVETLRRLFEKG